MEKLLTFLKGKKTYMVSGALVIYGILGYVLGYTDAYSAVQLILEGSGLAALRSGVALMK